MSQSPTERLNQAVRVLNNTIEREGYDCSGFEIEHGAGTSVRLSLMDIWGLDVTSSLFDRRYLSPSKLASHVEYVANFISGLQSPYRSE